VRGKSVNLDVNNKISNNSITKELKYNI